MTNPREYIPSLYDTRSDSRVSISLDSGIIPAGYPDAGDWVVTLQVFPLPDKRYADELMTILKEIVESRLGVKLDAGTHKQFS